MSERDPKTESLEAKRRREADADREFTTPASDPARPEAHAAPAADDRPAPPPGDDRDATRHPRPATARSAEAVVSGAEPEGEAGGRGRDASEERRLREQAEAGLSPKRT